MMKDVLFQIDKVLESRVRVCVMIILSCKEHVEFNELKLALGQTDGNLSTHLSTLEENAYILVTKTFRNKKPLSTYSITETGKEALKNHIFAMQKAFHFVQHPNELVLE